MCCGYPVLCNTCFGTGWQERPNDGARRLCPDCNGDGEVCPKASVAKPRNCLTIVLSDPGK